MSEGTYLFGWNIFPADSYLHKVALVEFELEIVFSSFFKGLKLRLEIQNSKITVSPIEVLKPEPSFTFTVWVSSSTYNFLLLFSVSQLNIAKYEIKKIIKGLPQSYPSGIESR